MLAVDPNTLPTTRAPEKLKASFFFRDFVWQFFFPVHLAKAKLVSLLVDFFSSFQIPLPWRSASAVADRISEQMWQINRTQDLVFQIIAAISRDAYLLHVSRSNIGFRHMKAPSADGKSKLEILCVCRR